MGTSDIDRFNDLQKQGFMKFRKAKKAKKPGPAMVACDLCQNWHRKGKHSASKAERDIQAKRFKVMGRKPEQREVKNTVTNGDR